MKKLLALVLAMVMTLGLATVGTSAAFSDADSIEYKEAVDVMSAIGVLAGMDDGSYNPTGILTREQAAKIVAYMLLGKSGADSLSAAAAPFSDVAADRWSAGSIVYCTSRGIIAGKGNGTFGPTEELTGYAFAKMLLCALDYDAAIQGYVGNEWQINVAKDVLSAKLNSGLTSVPLSQPMTREQAAKMALNCMNATIVTYATKGTTVTTTDGTSVVMGASSPVKNGGLFRATYWDKLTKNTTPNATVNNRPATTWIYKSETVGVYPDSPVVTFTESKTDSEVTNALTAYNLTAQTPALITNGMSGGVNTADTAAEIAAATGRGTLVEVYANSNNEVTYVTAENAVIATVNTINKTAKTVKLADAKAGTLFAEITETSDVYADVSGLSLGDKVLVTFTGATTNGATVRSVAVPETVVGTATYSGTNKVTVGGADYKATAYLTAASLAGYITTLGTQNYVLYMDKYGNVAFADTNASSAVDYAYVIDYSKDGTAKTGFTYNVQVLKADGAKEWFEVGQFNGEDISKDAAVTALTGTSIDNVTGYANGAIITYKELSDGRYNITFANDTGIASTTLTKNSTSITSANVKANDKTVFLFKNSDGTYASYTGIKNLPSKTVSGATIVANCGDTAAFAKMIVVRAGTKAQTAAAITYVVSESGSKNSLVNGTSYYTLKAIVDGQVKTLYCDNAATYDVSKFYDNLSYTDEEYGILDNNSGAAVTAIAAADVSKYYKADLNIGTGIVVDDETLTVDAQDYAMDPSNFSVYYYDVTEDDMVEVSLGASNIFKTDGSTSAVVIMDAKTDGSGNPTGIATAIVVVGKLA